MTPLEKQWDKFLIAFGKGTIATMAIPVIVALLYRKQWNKPMRVAFYYCLSTLSINLLEQGVIWAANQGWLNGFLAAIETDNTFFLLILYFLKDYIFIGWFLFLVFPQKNSALFIKWLSIGLCLFAIIDHLWIEGYRTMGPINTGLNALYLFMLPLLYLWVSQRQSIRIPIKNNPYFWVCLGIVIPNVLGLFLYFAGGSIHNSDFILFAKLASIRNGFDMCAQVIIAIGFSKSRFARFIQLSND